LVDTHSLEDIAVRARERLLELIYARLMEAAASAQARQPPQALTS
jgi:hypothetical protein